MGRKRGEGGSEEKGDLVHSFRRGREEEVTALGGWWIVGKHHPLRGVS